MNLNLKLAAIAVLMTASVVAAGCVTTGRIETKQTEPFRVQIDGAPQSFQASSSGNQCCQTQRVVVENSQHADQCDVDVAVTPKTTDHVTLVIRIEDETTHEVLVTKTIEAGGTSTMSASASASPTTSGNNTSGNNTTAPQNSTSASSSAAPSSGASSGQVVQQTINVNIKGKNNIVVITEAQQGSADVNIAAKATNNH